MSRVPSDSRSERQFDTCGDVGLPAFQGPWPLTQAFPVRLDCLGPAATLPQHDIPDVPELVLSDTAGQLAFLLGCPGQLAAQLPEAAHQRPVDRKLPLDALTGVGRR